MPRIVACAPCAIIQRIPDPPAKTPMTVARLEWESGEEYVYKDEHGKWRKPPDFVPPDVRSVLVNQGWVPPPAP